MSNVIAWLQQQQSCCVTTQVCVCVCVRVPGRTVFPACVYLNQTASGSEPLVDLCSMSGRLMDGVFVEDWWRVGPMVTSTLCSHVCSWTEIVGTGAGVCRHTSQTLTLFMHESRCDTPPPLCWLCCLCIHVLSPFR